ncbi:hypothetical protein ABIE44_001885 [Marmoricola sp. OAE513]|uniref:protein kinase family protein n=1 Tax=Marmoricola sp. OAE513 TaxID=2817894 RepID=UPI001AE7BAA0
MSMSPGTMLDGRYRMEVLLSEHDGARFWRATDTVLARSVAVHVLPSDDPRAPRVLTAARASAAVSDPHFLRVLDCADVDGLTWVINEWGDGVSLDVMLARGTLPALRAAWLTREVAEAIVAAHRQGLCHGRLNPEAVLVTESGSVKLIGFVVNAAFERAPATTSPYGELSPRDADVVDLAGILYAALTGKWPGVAPSALPAAPREGRRPLRPRQVRAGVPRTLDAICDRVLHKEASVHAMPIETALEIAAALSDFVGDPALVAPVDVPSMHDEPTSPESAEVLDPLETALVPPVQAALAVEPVSETPQAEPETKAETEPETETGTEPRPEPSAVVPSRPAARPAAPLAAPVPEAPPVAPPVAPPAAAPVAPPTSSPAAPAVPRPPARPAAAAEDPDATMAAPAPFTPSGLEHFEPEEWVPATPPPPFEKPVARPLFAEEERRVPATAAAVAAPTTSTGWPFDDEPSRPAYAEPPRRRRRGLKVFLAVLLVLAVAAAAYVAFVAGKDDGDDAPATSTGTPTATVAPPSATPVVTGTPVKIEDAGDFDPEGDPPSENPGQVRRAYDGDPATGWTTGTYNSAGLGGLKSGVGIVVDLGSDRAVTSVEVTLVGEPTDVEFYASPAGADAPPAELADTTRVGRVAGAESSATVRLESVRTRYLVVWLTRLPPVGGGFKGQIAEILVRS